MSEFIRKIKDDGVVIGYLIRHTHDGRDLWVAWRSGRLVGRYRTVAEAEDVVRLKRRLGLLRLTRQLCDAVENGGNVRPIADGIYRAFAEREKPI